MFWYVQDPVSQKVNWYTATLSGPSINQRRRYRELAADDLESWDKILCFADSREFVEMADTMNENEGSMHKMRITDRKLNGYGTITYLMHWFDRPLAQQLGRQSLQGL